MSTKAPLRRGAFVLYLKYMFRWVKHLFIPHRGNNHHPHFLRKPGRLAILFTVFILQSALVVSILIFSRTDLFGNIFPDVLVNSANTSRVEADLTPLVSNPALAEAAKAKAEDMAANGYFAHVSPDGKTPWFWLDKVGYKFSYAGENLAINFFDSKDLAEAWMQSPLHRANIMNGNFSEIGIATAQGVYEGRDTVFVVQFFGRPADASVSRIPKPQAQVTGSTEQQKFISVSNENIKSEDIGPVSTSSPSVAERSENIIQGIVASPIRTVNYIQFILLGLVVIALLLAVFVEIKVQKIAPIMSGFLLIAIIGGVVYVNHLISQVAQIL